MAASATALLVAQIGSASGSVDGATPKDGGMLHLNYSSSDLQSVDPALDSLFFDSQILAATCLQLVNFPDRPGGVGLQLIPQGAASMPLVSRDGRTYLFTVRPGLRFNTGEVVTAKTFAHTIERVLSPSMGSPYGPAVDDIVGAKEFLSGRATTVSGISTHGSTL